MKRNHSTILVGVIVFFYVFAPNSGGVNPQNKSTIVEILYVFSPVAIANNNGNASTIVEIFYLFTLLRRLADEVSRSTLVEIFYLFTLYACKITDYKRIIQTIVREISSYMAFPP